MGRAPKTCKTCEYWGKGPIRAGDFRSCGSGKILDGALLGGPELSPATLYGFVHGEDSNARIVLQCHFAFGCVHWEEKAHARPSV